MKKKPQKQLPTKEQKSFAQFVAEQLIKMELDREESLMAALFWDGMPKDKPRS